MQTLRAKLEAVGPYRKPDAESSHWSEMAVAFGFLPAAKRPGFERAYVLAAPLLQTLVLELAACWSLGFAFYRRRIRRQTCTVPPEKQRMTPSERMTSNDNDKKARQLRRDQEAIAYIQDYRSKSNRNPSIRHVEKKFSMPRSTAHRYIQYATAG